MKRGGPVRDVELARLLRSADDALPASAATLTRLSGRILAAAGPALEERAAPHRTAWDYTERWAASLVPIGALTAIAAGLCLFALSAQRPTPASRAAGVRVALLGAATNRVSSQNLLDFLVSSDPAATTARRSDR